MEQTAGPLVGLPVVTFDDHQVGAVEEAEPGRVRIRPRRGQSFWIPEVLVRNVAEDHARLHVDHRVLERYRQPVGVQPRRELGWWHRTTASAASLVSVVLATMFLG